MERFFRYSLEHDRPIRLMYMDEQGQLRQVNAVVEKREQGVLSLYLLRPIRRIEIREADVLSCDYARNDEGLD